MEELEAFLKHLGFTEYEARSYKILLKYGSLAADKISSLARIPLPRVYDTMLSLSNRGLISVSNSRPQTFRATDPKHLMKILKDAELKRTEEKIKAIGEMNSKFQKLISSLPKRSIFNGPEDIIVQTKQKMNVDKIWEDLQTKSEGEFFIFAGDISWADKRIDEVKSIVKRGVKFRVLFSRNKKEATKAARKLIKAGAEARYSEDIGNLRGIVSDGKRVFIVKREMSPEFENDKKFADYKSILIYDSTIASVFRRHFIELWSAAQNGR